MPKFRKKPIVIEAHHFTYDALCLSFLKTWMGSAFGDSGKSRHKDAKAWLYVKTLEDGDNAEAKHVATEGDWIIKGVSGEFYPCKPDIFVQTYELEEE